MGRRTALVTSALWAMLTLASGCGAATGGDAGPGDAGAVLETASATVSGARTASFSFDSDANYVSCISSASGLFSVTATGTAGVAGDGFDFIDPFGYDGPGTYTYTYSRGSSSNPTVTVYVGSSYSYQFGFDRSRITSLDVVTNCTLVVASAAGSSTRIDGTLTCTDLVARNISADYEAMPTDLQPHVNLAAQFSCELPAAP